MPLKSKYTLNDFNFDLPDELVAQYPAETRDSSRLFVLDRSRKNFEHDSFSNISQILDENSLLVFNNARVIPARLFFHRSTGAKIEIVLVRQLSPKNWLILANKMKKIKIEEKLYNEIDNDVYIKIIKRDGNYFEVEVSEELSDRLLKKIGKIPLPPYIRRDAEVEDMERYQTVYAKSGKAVAAPTAGLHFTDEIFNSLQKRGIMTAFTTLDVSWGTFSPVRVDEIENHEMHSESFVLDKENAEKINSARSKGRKIIAVGTTSLRVLESTFSNGKNIASKTETNIFIYPPYKIKSIDGLITNFHTPKSTLMMLVSAFAGYEKIMSAYREAVKKKYRFFSYGDSMYIR